MLRTSGAGVIGYDAPSCLLNTWRTSTPSSPSEWLGWRASCQCRYGGQLYLHSDNITSICCVLAHDWAACRCTALIQVRVFAHRRDLDVQKCHVHSLPPALNRGSAGSMTVCSLAAIQALTRRPTAAYVVVQTTERRSQAVLPRSSILHSYCTFEISNMTWLSVCMYSTRLSLYSSGQL